MLLNLGMQDDLDYQIFVKFVTDDSEKQIDVMKMKKLIVQKKDLDEDLKIKLITYVAETDELLNYMEKNDDD